MLSPYNVCKYKMLFLFFTSIGYFDQLKNVLDIHFHSAHATKMQMKLFLFCAIEWSQNHRVSIVSEWFVSESRMIIIERVLINDNFKTVFWILLTCLLVSSEKDKLTIVAIMNCSLTLKAKHLTILRKLVSFERRYNSERKKEKFLM